MSHSCSPVVGLKAFSGIGGASEHHCLLPHPSQKDAGGLYTSALTQCTFLHTWLKPISAPNRRNKQDQQGITTHIWPPHWEPIWLSKMEPQMP